MKDSYENRYFWIKVKGCRWIVAERRYLDRWFICGMSHIINDVEEVGEEIIHNEFFIEDNRNMEKAIAKIRSKIEGLRVELKKHTDALEALQGVCEHKWVDDGHGSHHTYSKCSICGKRDQD